MSSPTAYTIVDRIDEPNANKKKRSSATRVQTAPTATSVATSVRQTHPNVHSMNESQLTDPNRHLNGNRHENILFVYLDFHSQLLPSMVASLRGINDYVQTFSDESMCYDFLQTSTSNRIFFICQTGDKGLLRSIHELPSVEAIFVISSDTSMDRSRLPKIDGIYNNFEELLIGLRDALEWFEQMQVELFLVESDQIFLWAQLWKEEFSKPLKLHIPSSQDKLVVMAENYYAWNTRMLQSISEFKQMYSRSDALQWCFYSAFPSCFLHQAIRSQHTENLDHCRFLLTDISRILHQASKLKSGSKLFRGMKLTHQYVQLLEEWTGKLICAKDYLICTKSQKIAINAAIASKHRPDLIPVLFKITYDRSVPVAELTMKNEPTQIILDLYTCFRIKYVVRDSLTTVKLECADVDGRNIAREYLKKNGADKVLSLIKHDRPDPKPFGHLPPIEQKPTLIEETDTNSERESIRVKVESEQELKEMIERGEIDQVLASYKHMKHLSASILNSIGSLYLEKKGEYDAAAKCYKKALKIQEKNGEDPSGTLSNLAITHESRQQYDLAMPYHTRALEIRRNNPKVDQALLASSLLGIANSYWGQKNFTEALEYAQQALAINEKMPSNNDINLATNLAIIANIHHRSGKQKEALRCVTRALHLFERSGPADSPSLISLLNNIGAIQFSLGLFSDARASFDRALKVCEKTLPEGHPKRVTMKDNVERVSLLEQSQPEDVVVEI